MQSLRSTASDEAWDQPRQDVTAGPIQLAREGPIGLGPLVVEPALRRVASIDGREEIIQPRVMQVLVALAQAEGEILSRDDLLARCWSGVVVGEDAIDRVIGRLRRLCAAFAPDNLRLETIPRVGYRLILSETEETSAAPVLAPVPAPSADGRPVLAVLPFDNLSGDADFRYFADGVSEEILLTVAKTTSLQVIGRASSFQFRGPERSARRVSAELGATHVLDGAVRREGDSLRITAELVDCATQTRLWSDRFDGHIAEVFALQDEIAAAVAAALQARFAPSQGHGPIDPVAYDLYLRALDRNPEMLGFDSALLEQAVQRAPGFAQAWALLAFARAIALHWSRSSVTRAEVVRAAETALALDPSAAYAYLALEMAEPLCGHYAQRVAWMEKALAAAPNDPVVLASAAGIHDILGYQQLAYGYIVRSYQLDPRHAAFYYPCLLDTVGRREEGLAALDRDLARWPDSSILRAVAARFALESGDWERFEHEVANLPASVMLSGLPELLREHAEPFRHWSPQIAANFLAELRDTLARTGTAPVSSLGLPARHGLAGPIFDILERASFAHLHTPEGRLMSGEVALNVLFTPLYAHLRRDVRFVKLCARFGLVDHWIRTGRWPDFRAEVAPWYDLPAEAYRLTRELAPA